MTESSQALNSHDITLLDIHFPYAVEDSYASTEKRSIVCSICIRWDAHCGFAAEGTVFSVCASLMSAFQFSAIRREEKQRCLLQSIRLTSAIFTHSIYCRILADLEESAITRLAHAVVASMPGPTNAITYFPFLLSFANSNHFSNDLVAWDAREDVVAEVALLHEAVRVADATSLHLDKDFAGFWCRDRDIFNGPRRTFLLDNDSAAR